MKGKISLQDAAAILKNYQIEPQFVESMGKIHKIYTNNGVFALKKMDPHKGMDFIRHVQTLYQKGYNRIVPIYPTLDGRYAVLYENELYYLMPWLSSGVKKENQSLFREIARIHSISAREVKVNKEERTDHYEQSIKELEREEEFLEGCLEACEEKVYMSPFELLFCTYYHEINQALQFSKRKLTEWYDATKEKEKARMVISHGKITDDHFLFDEKGYGHFINFEQSHPGAPFHDILPYSVKYLRGNLKQAEDLIEWLYTYFKFFPLKEEEMQLFLSYLSHPSSIIKTAERLYLEGRNRNERNAVKKLQKDYFLLKNTEYVVVRIEEIERQKKQEEARNEQS